MRQKYVHPVTEVISVAPHRLMAVSDDHYNVNGYSDGGTTTVGDANED